MKSNLPATPWTKVPNALLDRLLPTLKDTELRILLVLTRATSGWNREGKSVPLTYRALMARTGRHSEAVAKAVASLSERGLIHASGLRMLRDPKDKSSENRRTTNKERN